MESIRDQAEAKDNAAAADDEGDEEEEDYYALYKLSELVGLVKISLTLCFIWDYISYMLQGPIRSTHS